MEKGGGIIWPMKLGGLKDLRKQSLWFKVRITVGKISRRRE